MQLYVKSGGAVLSVGMVMSRVEKDQIDCIVYKAHKIIPRSTVDFVYAPRSKLDMDWNGHDHLLHCHTSRHQQRPRQTSTHSSENKRHQNSFIPHVIKMFNDSLSR